jgi:hypothetical protein
MRSNRIR